MQYNNSQIDLQTYFHFLHFHSISNFPSKITSTRTQCLFTTGFQTPVSADVTESATM